MKIKYLIKCPIETKRLIIRYFLESDVNDVFEYAQIEGLGEKAGWKHHESILETKALIDKHLERKNTYAIALKENNKVIGSISLHILKNKTIRIGYDLSSYYWNKGYMTEVVKRVIDYIFRKTKYKTIVAGHFDNNEASKKVIEKCGFTFYQRIKSDYKFPTGYEMLNNYILIRPKFYKFKNKKI